MPEAPNINFAKEVYDLDLMANTIRAIFLAPRIRRSSGESGEGSSFLELYSAYYVWVRHPCTEPFVLYPCTAPVSINR